MILSSTTNFLQSTLRSPERTELAYSIPTTRTGQVTGSPASLYEEGVDVEIDTAKAIRHYDIAAMRGHVSGFNLGCVEGDAGNDDIALQHILIAANLGVEGSLNIVKGMFMEGMAKQGRLC